MGGVMDQEHNINQDILQNHIQNIEALEEQVIETHKEISQRNREFIEAHCPFRMGQMIHQVEKDGKEVPHKIMDIKFAPGGWEAVQGLWEIRVQRFLMDGSRAVNNANPSKVFSWQTWKEEHLPKGRG